MEKLQKLVDQNPKLKSDRQQYLKIKDAGGPVRVKLIGCENAKGRDYETQKEVQGVNLLFEQDGIEKKYFVPTLGKDGKYHYLIERFAEIKEGTELILEFKRKQGSVQGFIEVRSADGVVGQSAGEDVGEDEIPVIEEKDHGTSEEDFGAELDI